MKIFDLHCDTLGKALDEDKDLISRDFHVNIEKGLGYDAWVQCFAIFIPDEYRGNGAVELFNRAKDKLQNEAEKFKSKIKVCKHPNDLKNYDKNKCNIIFTVEGGAALGGEIKNLEHLYKAGVKMMTLTWNGRCEIGDGIKVENPKGLTEFGLNVVKKMEDLKMVIDISHASDALFYDVMEKTKSPLAASHSNSRTICNNKRNLTDEQFKEIMHRGGIVGINFCRYFLNSNDNPTISDIIKHVEHFLSLGGEKSVCLGADFDGAAMPDEISGVESLGKIYEAFLRLGYSQRLLQDIFFNNAYNFFLNFWDINTNNR
ncbi:MAG: dipeptidase [Clostridia bacterium]|nr:dipeptidase [Clostridia bacterium]